MELFYIFYLYVMMNRKCRYVTELHMVHSILKFSDLSHSVVRKIVHLPTSIMTDHRSRFYANTSEVKKKRAFEVE